MFCSTITNERWPAGREGRQPALQRRQQADQAVGQIEHDQDKYQRHDDFPDRHAGTQFSRQDADQYGPHGRPNNAAPAAHGRPNNQVGGNQKAAQRRCHQILLGRV